MARRLRRKECAVDSPPVASVYRTYRRPKSVTLTGSTAISSSHCNAHDTSAISSLGIKPPFWTADPPHWVLQRTSTQLKYLLHSSAVPHRQSISDSNSYYTPGSSATRPPSIISLHDTVLRTTEAGSGLLCELFLRQLASPTCIGYSPRLPTETFLF
ncbi:hypothetical protein HPB50_001359 [Hyalomma asiaticum]|uniref:Uncharacterized protein n=1 Tax=Hyalomma asiaticum TaxID=266040 RepID=A0ACB7RTK0_HYAAI|nr:hypothetical protein HPB50_001359 [Hyalomma asiaticum]